MKQIIPWKMSGHWPICFMYQLDEQYFIHELGYKTDSEVERKKIGPCRMHPDFSLDIFFIQTFTSWAENLAWEIAANAELERRERAPSSPPMDLLDDRFHAQFEARVHAQVQTLLAVHGPLGLDRPRARQ